MRNKFFFAPLVLILLAAIALFFIKKTKLAKCANSISCVKNLTGAYEEKREGIYMGKKTVAPEEILNFQAKTVLGSSTEEKHIYVDLSAQKLYAMEGNNIIYEFPVSTGKWSYTPTGDFNIWIKLRYTRMTGGNVSIGTYYNLPNVPYTMYFYNSKHPKTEGYGLHGAYWHNNFGHPMSHGCVNMKTEDVEKIYYWSNPSPETNVTYASAKNPSTPITIYGETPKE